MYPIENLKVTDFESAKKTAEVLFDKAKQPVEGYFYKNGCLVLAAMLLYLAREENLDNEHIFNLIISTNRNPDILFESVEKDSEISTALTDVITAAKNKCWDQLGGIWIPLTAIAIFLRNYKNLTLDEYRQRRSAIVKEIKLKTRELSNLTEKYCCTCPESEWIGKRVRAWALTSEKGKLKDVGTGYLKEIKHYEGDLFYYRIYLENEDGTPSMETYTGPIIVKVELFEN